MDLSREVVSLRQRATDKLREAIPPAYSEFIARAFLAQRKQVAA